MISNRVYYNQLFIFTKIRAVFGEIEFKLKAYEKAVTGLINTEIDLSTSSKKEVESISGVGKSVSDKVEQIKVKGSFSELEELLESFPKSFIPLLDFQGMSPKKIKLLLDAGVVSVEDAINKLTSGYFDSIKGFTPKSIEEFKSVFEYFNEIKFDLRLDDAFDFSHLIVDHLLKKSMISEGKISGELLTYPNYVNGLELELEPLVDMEIIEMEIQDFMDSQYLITPVEVFQGISEEEENPVPIECRENEEKYSEKVLNHRDIKGCLHNHSVWSDGNNSIEEMVLACVDRGLSYFGISDHSKTASYAGGLKPERVLDQFEEIEGVRKKYPNFTLFRGIESDILKDGSLDYEDDLLKQFDFIVASIHQNLDMDEKTATKRLIKAIENQYTNILGHPTGRLIAYRRGYPIDYKKIIDACADNQVIMELNASPWRLDMDWKWLPYCVEKGVMISINPDAHRIKEIDDMKYGTMMVRKSCIEVEHILNAQSAEKVKEIFLRKR